MTHKISPLHFGLRLGGIIAILLLSAIGCLAQIPTPPPTVPQFPGQTQPNRDENVWEVQQRKAMEKKSNLQRQQDIKKDTDKLLELATELKQEVDKTTENTLSVDVIKKSEEIEKLAKTVKDKMKGP